jgi:hypothetical protein
MVNILLSSEDTVYEVITRNFSAKGREKQVSAELHTKVKRELGVETVAKEQSVYLSIAAQAAFASLNKLDWLHSFHGEVNLKSTSDLPLSFTLESSSAGLGYALALALEWRKQLNKPNSYTVEVFATGEIHSSGAVTSIGHLDTKINAACNFMEIKNEVTQTSITSPKIKAPFVIFYPISNQDVVTPELEQRVEDLNGELCPVKRLQSALTTLLGDAYDGDSDGRWEPFKGLESFNYEDSL